MAAVGRRLRGTTMIAVMRIVTSTMRTTTTHHVASKVTSTTAPPAGPALSVSNAGDVARQARSVLGSRSSGRSRRREPALGTLLGFETCVDLAFGAIHAQDAPEDEPRSEERRVGKECVRSCSSRWSQYHKKKKKL